MAGWEKKNTERVQSREVRGREPREPEGFYDDFAKEPGFVNVYRHLDLSAVGAAIAPAPSSPASRLHRTGPLARTQPRTTAYPALHLSTLVRLAWA